MLQQGIYFVNQQKKSQSRPAAGGLTNLLPLESNVALKFTIFTCMTAALSVTVLEEIVGGRVENLFQSLPFVFRPESIFARLWICPLSLGLFGLWLGADVGVGERAEVVMVDDEMLVGRLGPVAELE